MDIKEKLTNELKEAKLSRKGKVVKDAVVEALISFAEQNSEFAQAIVQSEKPVADCIEYTVKCCGSAIADIEVYRRAAEFYFPTAKVKFNMTIDLGDDGFSNNQPEAAEPQEQKKATGLQLSLDDLLR